MSVREQRNLDAICALTMTAAATSALIFGPIAAVFFGLMTVVLMIRAKRTPWTRPSGLTCRLAPHTSGLVYDESRDVMVCPLCGHVQYEEMGG